ncbi:response regulator transcription factor [Chitinophaga sancti]|uniref:DNA-binding response regulator, NarL/FixJ family, contains REC and HTH domains n=1 Tax=Chitinophaga sancti TaxID=1004 RepID=A0A1K1SHI7_9BACT|nr:response regulator transcription factor [Chitinophaga sancti]WQD61822.1 response regulator transcription factor [Chitinophaga sancti]WQG92609.1 response regulator transcription factor [Chitinophaga sancti]SFW83833.1 DNA-binding response regulator, NarL/FixJ family, contains REC and HTH domains [Chitinophaga sancti]
MNTAVYKILLVDEDQVFVRQTRQLLVSQSYDTYTAASEEEGIIICQQHQPDLIICGAHLRGTGGHHFIMALRNDPAYDHIPLIFISLRDNRQEMRMAMNLGADDYLARPFRKRDLLLSIRSRLGRFAKFNHVRPPEETSTVSLANPNTAQQTLYHRLGKAENRIIKMIAEGKSTRQMAEELGVSIRTIENHRYRIAGKLGVAGRNALTEFVIRNIIQQQKS